MFVLMLSPILRAQHVLQAEPPADMVFIPAGTVTPFYAQPGNAKVWVERFWMDKTAVTNAEFRAFVTANPEWTPEKVPPVFADDGYLRQWDQDISWNQMAQSPVTNVSWYAATAYCEAQGKRLPTISEWEYAASADLIGYDKPNRELILEWYSKKSPSPLPPVKSTYKNEFGLYDMYGLIWEWVEDFNSVVLDGDSRSNTSLKRNLFCASGSFGTTDKEDYAAFLRYGMRGSLQASFTINNLGFRCVADPEN